MTFGDLDPPCAWPSRHFSAPKLAIDSYISIPHPQKKSVELRNKNSISRGKKNTLVAGKDTHTGDFQDGRRHFLKIWKKSDLNNFFLNYA